MDTVQIVYIQVNCPTIAVADAITETLLTDRLVASANRHAAIESAYVWDGQVQHAQEHPLRFKARVELSDAVTTAIAALHPYEVPSILCATVATTTEYAQWVDDVTRAS